MKDIIFPNNNEISMIEMAVLLGIKELILVYTDLNVKKIKDERIKLQYGYVIKENEYNKINTLKKKFDYIFAVSSRKAFENKNVNFIFDMELCYCKDSTHHRNSGLNQVLCKLAKKNKITLCINFNNLLNAKNKPLILGRIQQNIRLIKKYKNDFVIASFASSIWEMRNPKDISVLKII
ncbi:MAG: RNase P subunit p30 family protein [Candidatus Woesearchaeota archaeon]